MPSESHCPLVGSLKYSSSLEVAVFTMHVCMLYILNTSIYVVCVCTYLYAYALGFVCVLQRLWGVLVCMPLLSLENNDGVNARVSGLSIVDSVVSEPEGPQRCPLRAGRACASSELADPLRSMLQTQTAAEQSNQTPSLGFQLREPAGS